MPRHRACRVDGVQQCRVDVERPPRSGDGARTRCRTAATPPSRRGAPKKKTYSFDLPEEYTRKTDGRRRPMPQQIWKGPEIKITDAPPRRLTSAAGAHDAWETARPLRHD